MSTLDRFTPNSGGACPECGWVVAFAEALVSTTCPQCQTRIALTYVVASYNQAMPCDDRCQYARGPRCSCSCGGDNHRRGYIYVETVPQWVRDRDAKEHNAKKARREATRQARAEKLARERADAHAAQLAAWPELRELATAEVVDWQGSFIDKMRTLLQRGEVLTPAQAEATVRNIQINRRRAAQEAQWAAEREAALAAEVRCPAGTQTFTGRIATVKLVDGWHGRYEVKMLVVTEAGWKVWGTCPRRIAEPAGPSNADEYEAHRRSLRGRTVRVTADLTPKEDDQLFGVMKRPRIQLIDEPAEAAA